MCYSTTLWKCTFQSDQLMTQFLLHHPVMLQAGITPCSIRTSSLVKLARPSTSSSLWITDLVPSSMLPLVSGTNSRLPFVNHALISPLLHHPVFCVALPPSVPSTHHFRHPLPLHSSTPGLKLSFSANLSHHSFPFLLPDWLDGFPRLFTDTSQQIRFSLFSFSVFHFLVFGSVR